MLIACSVWVAPAHDPGRRPDSPVIFVRRITGLRIDIRRVAPPRASRRLPWQEPIAETVARMYSRKAVDSRPFRSSQTVRTSPRYGDYP
ncbi:hypothetical protein [Lysobacter gummosus]|uniref:hypothetical protein n=1 Tax=Lysobacter gummosus TaxID=262324 RepID=UPI003641477E